MANIANLTPIYNGELVEKLFTALTGSSGDGSPATWRYENSKPIFARPTITLSARSNKARTARHVDMKVIVPYTVTNTVTSQEEPVARAMFMGQWILPSNVPQTVNDDLVYFATYAQYNAAMIAQIKTGYSFT